MIISEIDYDKMIESLAAFNEDESLLVDNLCYKYDSVCTPINSNLGDLFQCNSCESSFKMSTCSNNYLIKDYLDIASISTSNVEAITTILDTNSGSIEE